MVNHCRYIASALELKEIHVGFGAVLVNAVDKTQDFGTYRICTNTFYYIKLRLGVILHHAIKSINH